MNLVFITGSSGVGKTPLVGILKSILPNKFDVHDLDEKLLGVDISAPNWLSGWRNETTQYFTELAIQNAKENKSTIVCGIVWPHEVQAASNMHLTSEVKFIFLDVEAGELKKRLFARRWSDESKIVALKKDTGLTPDEYIAQNMLEVSRLKKECEEFGAKIVDTTQLDSSQLAGIIKDFLTS